MTLESRGIDHHISSEYNRELLDLHAGVIGMGALVQTQLRDAVRALVLVDASLAETVIAREPDVNAMELRIDQEANLVLVRRQPAAGDLRLVFAILKAVIDLERVGDIARRIAAAVLEYRGPEALSAHVGVLGSAVEAILATSLDAFSRLDLELALGVRAEDSAIDAECKAVSARLMVAMTEDSGNVSTGMSLVLAARSLERAGDHAKNIAEYVSYAVLGKDIRHMKAEEREQWLRSRESPQA